MKNKKYTNMKGAFTSFILICVFAVILVPSNVAFAFSPNNILSDYEMTDYKSMSLFDIQTFLQRKGSYLAYYYPLDVDGYYRTAAEVIWRAANKYKINPKVLLITLQKEQSLVESSSPSQYNLDWATGYARCDDYDTCGPDMVPEHKGFAKQVDDAAGWYRWYMDGNATFLKKPGVTYNIDGYSITPTNLATASLYAYTPHYHGNYNFWKISNRWFSKYLPSGALLKVDGNNTAWLLKDGIIRPIKSLAVLFSQFQHLSRNVITVTTNDLNKYEQGPEIKFPDYTLLRSPNGTIYLTIGDYRRGIKSMEAFSAMGFNMKDVINVGWDDINTFKEGAPITVNTSYPIGKLIQNNKTGGVYFVEDGIKSPIWSKEILNRNFSDYIIHATSPEELDKITTGNPIKFNDGELVKSFNSPEVYFISDGTRMPIANEKTFLSMGWKWENIISTNEKAINLHPLGDTISDTNSNVGLASY